MIVKSSTHQVVKTMLQLRMHYQEWQAILVLIHCLFLEQHYGLPQKINTCIEYPYIVKISKRHPHSQEIHIGGGMSFYFTKKMCGSS